MAGLALLDNYLVFRLGEDDLKGFGRPCVPCCVQHVLCSVCNCLN